jgi:membrane protease YdiL (CAAX protease family)
MNIGKKYAYLFEATLCSFGLMIFSFFISFELPFRIIAFTALMLPAYIVGKNLKSFSDLNEIIGEFRLFKNILLYFIIGLLSGILIASFYRWYLGTSLFPVIIHGFVFIAALIGAIEEVVFRGFIQEYVRKINAPFSILFSTISHTGYKCCLFLSPVITADIDIGFLALWTFIAGIIFGSIRHITKSVLPTLIAHAVFDILVYAEFLKAPWWVF